MGGPIPGARILGRTTTEEFAPNTPGGVRRKLSMVAERRMLDVLSGRSDVDEMARLRPPAERVGPTYAELSESYQGIPESNCPPAFTRA